MRLIERQIFLDIVWVTICSGRINSKLRDLSSQVGECKPAKEAAAVRSVD
jgi:hypothetical protein